MYAQSGSLESVFDRYFLTFVLSHEGLTLQFNVTYSNF